MRRLTAAEKKQRACEHCVDGQEARKQTGLQIVRYCPHDECPYHEMDKFASYTKYLKSIGGSTIKEVLKSLGLGSL